MQKVFECTLPDGTFVACGTISEMAEKLGIAYRTMQRRMETTLVVKCVGTKESGFSGSYADVEKLVFGEKEM